MTPISALFANEFYFAEWLKSTDKARVVTVERKTILGIDYLLVIYYNV